MSASASQEESCELLDLPRPLLADLFQHVASGPGGLASAASLSQACSSLHALSESSAVFYRDIHVRQIINSSVHPVWQWLEKRQGRVIGLKMEVEVDVDSTVDEYDADPDPEWMQPLQTLAATPGLHLTVSCTGTIDAGEEPFMEEWLKPHGYLMDALTAEIEVSAGCLSLREFCEAAAPCRSIQLTVRHEDQVLLNLTDLAPVLGSLVQLDIEGKQSWGLGQIVGNFDTLISMPKLTSLSLTDLDPTAADPLATLAMLSSLEDLTVSMSAHGDPSVFSELTRLSFLDVSSYRGQDVDAVPFSFSSLQPLSALRQLERLFLSSEVFKATSLQGLAGLNRLECLCVSDAPNLVSLEGISGAITYLSISNAKRFHDLSGIGVLTVLEQLKLYTCEIASLQPLAGLSCLQSLKVVSCPLTSLEGLEGGLSTSLQSLRLSLCESFRQLSVLEKLSSLQELYVSSCGVTSLQPLAELTGGLAKVYVGGCNCVKEEILELPHIQPTADVKINYSNVKEVVLAGGVRRVMVYQY